MRLKYLLIPVVALALGIVSPVTLAKGHEKPQAEHKDKAHKKTNSHKKHEKKSTPKKHECDGKSCIKSHPKKNTISAPLPYPLGITAPLPTPPKVSTPKPQLPANPVNDLIDQTAHEAKQKAREKVQ